MKTLAAPLAMLALLTAPAQAGVKEVIEAHVLPGTAAFAEASAELAQAAQADCTPEGTRPAYNAAFDAWLGIAHLRFGPLEENGRDRAIAFWPDKKGFTPRILSGLIAEQDPAVADAAQFADVSVAARGLFALERMLYDGDFDGYAQDSYACGLTIAIARDLARMAERIDVEWRQTQAPLMLSAGAPDNASYLTPDEASRQLYTALLAGLEFTADQRLGRPLGTFADPRPERAEARRSQRSQRNVTLSLRAMRDFALELAGQDVPITAAAFDSAIDRSAGLDDPDFAQVSDPSGRLKVEIVQQRVQAARRAVEGEVGLILGVGSGFNSADGD